MRKSLGNTITKQPVVSIGLNDAFIAVTQILQTRKEIKDQKLINNFFKGNNQALFASLQEKKVFFKESTEKLFSDKRSEIDLMFSIINNGLIQNNIDLIEEGFEKLFSLIKSSPYAKILDLYHIS